MNVLYLNKLNTEAKELELMCNQIIEKKEFFNENN